MTMAHDQRHYRKVASALLATSTHMGGSSGTTQLPEDEDCPEQDEPPDERLLFGRLPVRPRLYSNEENGCDPTRTRERRKSLLTQGLLTTTGLTSVDSTGSLMAQMKPPLCKHSNGSVASTAELTSDGGMTSPARTITPSPPLPYTDHINLIDIDTKELVEIGNTHLVDAIGFPSTPLQPNHSESVGPANPRKRCITFVCSRPLVPQNERASQPCQPEQSMDFKRSSMLRFACPVKPAAEDLPVLSDTIGDAAESAVRFQGIAPESSSPLQSEGQPATDKAWPAEKGIDSKVKSMGPSLSSQPKASPKILRFHEFASSYLEEEDWVNAKPAQRRKITVNDTLRKENAIRRLGEEAEAEALQEELDEADIDNSVNHDDMQDPEEDWTEEDEERNEEEISDDGNETDDEEGFAASDDESEADSKYQFWRPGLTTAATSAEQLYHIRPRQDRSTSESSTGSVIDKGAMKTENTQSSCKQRGPRRNKNRSMMRPGTPELPDSTDFVCGTLDEDRPLEVAYLSCLEQRKIAKNGIVPQDLDPSFPTSEPEQDDTDEDVSAVDNSLTLILGHFDDSDSCHQRGRLEISWMKRVNTSIIAPKRLHSPAPKRQKSPAPTMYKHFANGRFPPLFRGLGHSPRGDCFRPRPPSCSRQRLVEYGPNTEVPYPAQRPNLTRTNSLPRTPDPFWCQHDLRANNTAMIYGGPSEGCSNSIKVISERNSGGPIDIIQGLQRNQVRRRNKFWRQHYRDGGKDKEFRSQRGKGAKRMRKLGLEMADKCRGHGERVQLVLSI